MASEELKQRGQTKKGYEFGDFEYFDLGGTTIATCVKYGILPKLQKRTIDAIEQGSNNHSTRKPDGIIVDRRGTSPTVIAVVEFKDDLTKDDGMHQASVVAALLDARFCIVTDTNRSIWLLPSALGIPTVIRDEHGREIRDVFGNVAGAHRNDVVFAKNVKITRQIFDRLQGDMIQPISYLDPSALARSVWQDVYVGAGSTSAERALSTFVELFMFKFLSDIGILTRNQKNVDISFSGVLAAGEHACLNIYWDEVRPKIKEMFPSSAHDNTTIINGFALTPHNKDHGRVFFKILKRFADFQKENGGRTLRDIDREFKSRLYEEFLKGSVGQKSAGQFFTPRKVMRALVEMAEVEMLATGAVACDPACGVGGFLLEAAEARKAKGKTDFAFKNGKLTPAIHYVGFEKDPVEERDNGKLAIILAKSNFVIYQSDLLAEFPHATTEFAKVFNDIFSLKKGSVLGSLQSIDTDTYDLVLSNPPYVASGSSTLKAAAQANGLSYSANGCGVEGLFVEKIVREIKPGGRAFIILPDGTFTRAADGALRSFVADECYIDALVALPKKTFFATTKKTYVLCITKKEKPGLVQTSDVMCYLVSNIGETLDADRLPFAHNDLPDLVSKFRQFQALKRIGQTESAQVSSPRSRLISIEEFATRRVPNAMAGTEGQFSRALTAPSWMIERFWTNKELADLGLYEERTSLDRDGWAEKLSEIATLSTTMRDALSPVTAMAPETKSICFRFAELFDTFKGDSKWTKKYASENKGDFPLYTAATKNVVPLLVNKADFETECLLMTTNGVYGGTLFYHPKHAFSVNGDAMVLTLKPEFNDVVDYQFARLALTKVLLERGFNWENKPSKDKLRDVLICFPIDDNGLPDIGRQRSEAQAWNLIEKQRNELETLLGELSKSALSFG